MDTLRCCKCQQVKSVDEFWCDKSRSTGRQAWCIACCNTYRTANRERVKQTNKAYYEANKDRWHAYNKDHYAERTAYKQSARGKAAARAYKQSEAGREGTRAYNSKRRAQISGANGSHNKDDIEAVRVAQGNRCYLCKRKLGKHCHVDHFIPLALGGTNDPGNLRLACPKCNLSKGAKHPHELGLLI